MPVAQDDNGVAVILAHQVAYALACHGAERMSPAMGAQAIGQILSVGGIDFFQSLLWRTPR